jgi:uncharacterized protein YegJ (DUF2314 family)
MFLKRVAPLLLLLFASFVGGQAQQPDKGVYVAPNAPKDQVKQANAEETKKFEEAIKPYVEKARKTYPEARKRYLAGLPPKHTFFVTTRLRDADGRFEQVFVAVKEINDGVIKGLIWSDVELVTKYKKGDSYSFPESDLIDWTISNPDGMKKETLSANFSTLTNTDSSPDQCPN